MLVAVLSILNRKNCFITNQKKLHKCIVTILLAEVQISYISLEWLINIWKKYNLFSYLKISKKKKSFKINIRSVQVQSMIVKLCLLLENFCKKWNGLGVLPNVVSYIFGKLKCHCCLNKVCITIITY